MHAPNVLLVDRHDIVAPNGALVPSKSSPIKPRPLGAKC